MKKEPPEIIHWKLLRGCGKANVELARISNSTTLIPDHHFLMIICREEIECCEFSRLRYEFSLDQPAKKLASMLGRVTFAVSDYDDTEEELFEIPAVRKAFREVTLHYPCWLAFAALQTETTRVTAACAVSRMHVLKRTNQPFGLVWIPRDQLTRFFENALGLAATAHQCAGISPRAGRKLLEKAAKHLGLT